MTHSSPEFSDRPDLETSDISPGSLQSDHPLLSDELPQYDTMSAEFRRDPYPTFARLRREDPVHWTAAPGMWVLTRYADIVPLLKDRRLGVVPASIRQMFLGDGPALMLSEKILGFIDPPDHTRLRGLVGSAFTPRAVEALRPRVQTIVDKLIDRMLEKKECDLMTELALPLPVFVISEMLGVPDTEYRRFKEWTEHLLLLFDSPLLYTEERIEACNQSAMAIAQYLYGLIDEKRSHPGEDLISALIAAEREGDRLSEFEVVQMSANLMLGGYETTMGLIGNGILALLQNPEQLELLRNDPGLSRRAVEETLRYNSSFIATVRYAQEPLEVHGKRIDAGDMVCLVLAAANRDPAQFPEPDRFDITRTSAHIGFGGGPHVCLGAPLARLEGDVVFATVARRMPVLRLEPQELEWRPSQITRILRHLRVRC